MRDQGRLVEWLDEHGYGFIQPSDSSKERVFLHIKDFARPGPLPIVGCALEYLVILDERGRFRAQQVTYLKASQVQHAQLKPSDNLIAMPKKISVMQILCVLYILAIVGLSLAGLLSGIAVLALSLVNVATYWFYAQDKEAAHLGKRRIPEQSLHLLSFLGGWPAAWLAQEKLRHKTQKQPFRRIYFCTIGFNILLILWLISPFNPF